MLSVKSLSLSLVVSVIGIVLYSVFYNSSFVDEFIEKSFTDKTRNRLQKEENMTSIFQKIAQNVLLKAPAGPETTFGELWKEQRSVIVFFRRFG